MKNSLKIKIVVAAFLATFSFGVSAETTVIQGEVSPGNYVPIPVNASTKYLMVDCPGCTGASAPNGANNADGVASVSTGLAGVVSYNFGYNGITWDRFQLDASKYLLINCAVGCAGGTTSNAADAIATSATSGKNLSWLYGFNGTTWDRLRVDASKNLNVNCAAGCSAGTASNASDAVATSSTNATTNSWLYGFNGSTWDRLQVDASKFLKVNVAAALPTGANVIGAVTQSGTWTVTANLGTLNGAALDASVTGLQVSQGASSSGVKGSLILGNVTTAAPSYTTAQSSPLSLTTTGALRTDASATTQPVSGTVTANAGSGTFNIQSNAAVNIAQLAGTATDTNSGNKSAGTLRVVLATDQPQNTTALKVDGSSATQPVSGTVTITLPTAATPYHLASAASTNSTNIKASAGTLYALSAVNTTATIYYLRMYDSSSAPTCSSATNAVHTYPVPASATGAGISINLGTIGEAYANGISFCLTGGGADTDNTSAATGVYINASYK